MTSDDQVSALAPVLSLLDRHERTIMELFLSADGDAPTLDEVAASTGLPATLVRSKRIKQWTFYRRDEERIGAVKTSLIAAL